MRTLLVVLALLVPFSASAVCDFTPTDWVQVGLYGAYVWRDTEQTRQISTSRGKYHEKNPIIGEQPSEERVIAYMLGSAILSVSIACYLEGPNRTLFLFGVTVDRILTTEANARLGLRASF